MEIGDNDFRYLTWKFILLYIYSFIFLSINLKTEIPNTEGVSHCYNLIPRSHFLFKTWVIKISSRSWILKLNNSLCWSFLQTDKTRSLSLGLKRRRKIRLVLLWFDISKHTGPSSIFKILFKINIINLSVHCEKLRSN